MNKNMKLFYINNAVSTNRKKNKVVKETSYKSNKSNRLNITNKIRQLQYFAST